MNPFTDIGFKIIFGQPASKPFLITLLNELLAGEHRIEDLVFLDKEDHAEHVRDKGIIGSPDKPGGLSIQLCKSEKKEFYIRYSS